MVNGTSNVVNYGTCSTAAATAAKAVSCSNFGLITGAEITVKFTTTNTAANPTLNVNSTGAKAIYYRGSAISAGYLAANRTYTFKYNGSQYDLVGDINTDTNTKVTQTVTTSNASYPLLLAPSGQTATTTTTSYFDSGVTLNPSTNTIAANVSGNANSASKVNNKLTVGSKTFNGSAAVTIAASDLGLASAMLFLGTTTTAITDGATTNPITISGANKTVTAGNVVLYGSKEFVWNGSAWEELGNEGSYKIVQAAVADPSASGISNTFIATISQDANGKITATKKTVAVTNSAPTLSWGATSTIGSVAGTNLQVKMPANPNTDTKNTAGSTNISSKIFLIGATSQSANPQTYSHDTAYVGTDGCLYSNNTKVSVNGHTHSPTEITDGYTSSSFYINTHPENNPTIIPFINNDIAFLTKRGGSVVVKYDNTAQSTDISHVFDGSGSYWQANPKNIPTITIELELHKVFTWTNTIYIDSGANAWRAKDMKIEVINTNYADDVWTTKGSVTNYGRSQWKIITSHTPSGASNASGGFNKIRFTFSNWNNSTIFRIACLGVISYSSTGIREISLPRDGGIMYGGITPYANNSYNLGSSSNKYANVYATNFQGNASTATKWATARNINGMSVQGDSNRFNYGTCSTEAATAAKVVSCTGFALATGSEITVKFTVTNTASNPTLNVNNTGAKAIYYRGAAISAGYLAANRTYTFRYNGNQYDLVGDLDTNTSTTTGTSNKTGTKLFLAGATSQATAPTTYSNSNVYIGTDNCLYSNNAKVATAATKTAQLTVSGWSSNQQTVSVSGITANNLVIISPDPAASNYSAYTQCEIRCTAQAANKLTFTCKKTPSIAITVNIAVIS